MLQVYIYYKNWVILPDNFYCGMLKQNFDHTYKHLKLHTLKQQQNEPTMRDRQLWIVKNAITHQRTVFQIRVPVPVVDGTPGALHGVRGDRLPVFHANFAALCEQHREKRGTRAGGSQPLPRRRYEKDARDFSKLHRRNSLESREIR